jgi:hypothetical protein
VAAKKKVKVSDLKTSKGASSSIKGGAKYKGK